MPDVTFDVNTIKSPRITLDELFWHRFTTTGIVVVVDVVVVVVVVVVEVVVVVVVSADRDTEMFVALSL